MATETDSKVRVLIDSDADIVTARQEARALAQKAGFDGTDVALIAIATSEAAGNIIRNSKRGEILVSIVHQGETRGISIVARDGGDAMEDQSAALEDDYTNGNGISRGLRRAIRRMDESEVESVLGSGTVVKMKKWMFR
ncbi:MAG: ATP-binding protein [Acidobacteria bacterium]|nr:MAG: ATP-binding protein [Acidobacteriota bacterium]